MMDLTGARWRKAARSTHGAHCVEVADNLPDVVGVRDSKDPSGPALAFTREEWRAFMGGVADGQLDLD